MKKILNYKDLYHNAVAPLVPCSESEKIVVGDIFKNQQNFRILLKQLIEGDFKSQPLFITGANGNGKSFFLKIRSWTFFWSETSSYFFLLQKTKSQ